MFFSVLFSFLSDSGFSAGAPEAGACPLAAGASACPPTFPFRRKKTAAMTMIATIRIHINTPPYQYQWNVPASVLAVVPEICPL